MEDIKNEVLIKASQGDLDSFEMIYRATSGFVYSVALRVVHHKEEAEEVTQEVFMTAYRTLKSFRFESSFKTWLYRIAVNCAIDHARRMSKENSRRTEYDENFISAQASLEAGPDMSQEYKENLVNTLLKTLNPDQRACVVLRNIEGLSYQEIAETLKTNINTVRSRLKRARQNLWKVKNEVMKNEM